MCTFSKLSRYCEVCEYVYEHEPKIVSTCRLYDKGKSCEREVKLVPKSLTCVWCETGAERLLPKTTAEIKKEGEQMKARMRSRLNKPSQCLPEIEGPFYEEA